MNLGIHRSPNSRPARWIPESIAGSGHHPQKLSAEGTTIVPSGFQIPAL